MCDQEDWLDGIGIAMVFVELTEIIGLCDTLGNLIGKKKKKKGGGGVNIVVA